MLCLWTESVHSPSKMPCENIEHSDVDTESYDTDGPVSVPPLTTSLLTTHVPQRTSSPVEHSDTDDEETSSGFMTGLPQVITLHLTC